MSNWISVKDKMPESKKGVIIHLTSGFITVGYLTSNTPHERKWQLFGDKVTLFVEDATEVSHWQPLPEPPKRELI